MNTALWIVAGVLAFVFVGSGVMKLVLSKEKLVAQGLGGLDDVDPNAIRGIGAAEVAGAIGLIVPPLVHILPVLTPLAAVGLAAVMVGAIVTHGRRKEYPNVAVNVVLLGLALFVAWGRFGAYAF
ncbi:DoxX family protein [Mycolicibacterium mucogenicum]|uniref:DoxX family protein n=1 Tax=Mycolicibacterium mucogenicum DSM 44124 TaxID=1226753 RepID=A0A8H2PIB3_MYCMU|nr:DoxX family protein [Mycolicibacterium mucogenicum]KAB7760670.1 DoxX family protein [Mycolicibacterium mucogenicum DSM 44124]QPG68021.1 DoxX family protein [Mycolicibacterium mucogenicum DSM 44124]